MKRILFVCHGNICRSPTAEFVFKDLVKKAGLSDKYYVASRATSTEEIGNPVYPPAGRELLRHGISPDGKRAVQLIRNDYEDYDYIIGMDEANVRNMKRLFGPASAGKIHKLLSFKGEDRDVSDPWYHGGFDLVYSDIYEGCVALLEYLERGA